MSIYNHLPNSKILDVDLTSRQITTYDLPQSLVEQYIGGAGINARILIDEVPSDCDPLGPENILIFGAGPLVGTRFPCTGRFTVTTKSPITGIYADSNAGGNFGARMRQAGFSHIILRGAASTPVYILIKSFELILIEDASELWGADTIETDQILQERIGQCESARIGPGGENCVLYANIASSSKRLSFNGRTGAGAVMGSKNCKAIAIETSNLKPIEVDNPHFKELIKRYRETIRQSPGCDYRASTGTLNIMTAYNVYEDVWQKNYQQKVNNETAKKLEPEAFFDEYYTGKKSGCWACSLACSLHWKINKGNFAGVEGEKVEFGHTFPLGANLGCFDFDGVLYLSDLANRSGLDSMELGFTMGFYTECLQRNLIPPEAIEVRTEWGNAEAFGKLVKQIINKRGIGEILSLGVRHASDRLGQETKKFAFHYKGQAYRAEKNNSWILAFAVSPRGGDHLKAMAFTTFAFGTPHAMKFIAGPEADDSAYDMESPMQKGKYVWWHENYKTIVDSMGICIFPLINLFLAGEATINDLYEIFIAATGLNISLNKFWAAGERSFLIMKIFNSLSGITRKNDTLPHRSTGDPDSFNFQDIDLNKKGMLDLYYYLRGFSHDGLPTFQRLSELGLHDLIGILEKKGLLRNESCAPVEMIQ